MLSRSRSKHHDRLLCVDCTVVLEFAIPELPLLQQKVAGEYGFELTHQRHVLFGVCPQCRARGSHERNGRD
jgi:Fur family transcriptional regulator, ferric uptake regulator